MIATNGTWFPGKELTVALTEMLEEVTDSNGCYMSEHHGTYDVLHNYIRIFSICNIYVYVSSRIKLNQTCKELRL